MKTIIRQILDDLKPAVRPATDEIKKDTPKLNQPLISGPLPEPHHNEGQIVIENQQPHAPKLEPLHLDAKVLRPTPEDLNAQILSDDPAERLRQLDFQAQKGKERQLS
jgi:hypothetical protein